MFLISLGFRIVSLGDPKNGVAFNSFFPQPLPLTNAPPFIAPFWIDHSIFLFCFSLFSFNFKSSKKIGQSFLILDPQGTDTVTNTLINNVVYYRHITNGNDVFMVSAYIRDWLRIEQFSATDVVIVTWNSVNAYDSPAQQSNTFQLILVTDGIQSYALFFYARTNS
jgi:hypothetical protein